MEELRTEEVKASRSRVDQGRSSGRRYGDRGPQQRSFSDRKPQFQDKRKSKSCRLCKAEGRRYMGHSLSDCRYIDQGEKFAMIRSCVIDSGSEDACDDYEGTGSQA